MRPWHALVGPANLGGMPAGLSFGPGANRTPGPRISKSQHHNPQTKVISDRPFPAGIIGNTFSV